VMVAVLLAFRCLADAMRVMNATRRLIALSLAAALATLRQS
jgi:hypothetical protein